MRSLDGQPCVDGQVLTMLTVNEPRSTEDGLDAQVVDLLRVNVDSAEPERRNQGLTVKMLLTVNGLLLRARAVIGADAQLTGMLIVN